MFYQPKLLKGLFNRYYLIAKPGDGLPHSGIAKPENLYGCADYFVRGLDASDSDWRSLLSSFPDIDLRHTRKPYSELVANLLHNGRIRAYQVPSPDELRRLASCTSTDKKTGLRYVFMPGNACLMVKADYQKPFTSLKDAESFLESAQLTDEQITSLASFVSRDLSLSPDARKGLARALAEGSLVVGVAPPGAPAKPKGPLPEEVVSPRPVSLGPHAEPGYVPPVLKPKLAAVAAPAKPAASPQTLGQAAQRLHDAKPAVQTAKLSGTPLPASTYTLQDKQKVVENGLQEKFLVRVIETGYAGDHGFIGKVREHGSSISWTAPLSMVEHGDTDAEALLNAFGTRHSPTKSYTILIIDTEKMSEIGDVQTIIPTNDNLYRLIAENRQLTKVEPEVVKQVLNEDFSPKYEAFANGIYAEELDQEDFEALNDLALEQGNTQYEADLLKERHQLANDVAAWEIFTGNGMTRDTNVKDRVAYGPVEVVMLDKKPMQIGELKQQKALTTLLAS